MNGQQIDQFLISFKVNLQKKVVRLFVISIMTFFAILALFKLIIIYQNINVRNQNEFTYLQRVGRKMLLDEELQLNALFLFLQAIGKLVETSRFSLSTIDYCNSTYFDCQVSSNSANFMLAAAMYQLIEINSQLLAFSDRIGEIFIFAESSTSSKVFFNKSQLNLNQQFPINYSIIDQFITNSSQYSLTDNKNSYILVEAAIAKHSFYQIICQSLTLQSKTCQLCILSIVNKTGFISETKKNIFFRVSNFSKLSTGITSYLIVDWINNNTVQIPQTQAVLTCISLRNDNIVLQEYFSFEGESQICKATNYLFFDIFGPFFTYIRFKLRFPRIQAPMLYSSLIQPQQAIVEYYISSNTTYYQDMQLIISTNTTQLRYIGYGLIAIIGLSLLLIKYPDELVENNIISSILQIHNLYEHLRSKEEKEFANIYSKERTTVFSFIADYLNKYMWVYKLIKSNKEKAKYKKFLKEGIQLFSQDDFPVKRYIFKELIRLENKLIDSLLKVRQLPIKKKETHKLQFQLPQTKIMHNHDKDKNKRRNANLQLLNPDDDQLMKNISVSFKPNRGVRFSNDIQTVEIDRGPIFRKSKMTFMDQRSCETIKNDLSQPDLESIKPGDVKDSIKSLKDEQQSYNSLNELSRSRKKESSLRSRGLQSIYADIQNMRLDEQQSEIKQALQQQNLEQKQLFGMSRSRQTFAQEISNTYHRTMEYYKDLIKLKADQAKAQRREDLLNSVNIIYEYTLEKYELMAKMLAFENQMNLPIDQQQREEISKFQDLDSLQRDYTALIKNELLQNGEIIRMQIHQSLFLPVSFRNLQFLARSQQSKVRVVARRLLAEMSQKLSPHLDNVLMRNIFSLLQSEKTSCNEKRNLLVLLTRTLERYYSEFTEQIAELKLARQFYNKKNKKIYFIASILNPKPFSKFIDRLYQYIQPFDMLTIFNLQEECLQNLQADISEPLISRGRLKKNFMQKVKFQLNQQDFSQMFNFVQDRVKEIQQKHGSSTKTITKKKFYQKEFYEILNCIEADETQFSKYLFVLLGQEHNSYLGQPEQSSSSGNHRPQQQKIHQEITKIIDKGYYHIVLAGHQLSLYPSKYGKLKKYLKLSPELLEIELGDKQQQQNFLILQKYLK